MKSEALATVRISDRGVLQPATFAEAKEMAQLISESGMVPEAYHNKPGAVLVAIQMGAELGLSPMSAIQNIAVINGRPSLWGDAGLALVRTHPDFLDIEEHTDKSDPKNPRAECTIRRRGRVVEQTPVARSFSWAEATKAGLAGKKGPWSQYPARMLQMRARWLAMRDAFPDALRGVASAEESLDIDAGRPDYVEPLKPGKSSFVRKAEPAAVEPTYPLPDVPAEEPEHDEDTGEVVEAEATGGAGF